MSRKDVERQAAAYVAETARALMARIQAAERLERTWRLATHQLPGGEWESGQVMSVAEDGSVQIWPDTAAYAITPYEAVEQAARLAEVAAHDFS